MLRFPKRLTIALFVIYVAALVWSYIGTKVDIPLFIDGLPFFMRFLRGLFPPDFGMMRELWTPLIQTVQMSIFGTTLAVVLSLPFGILAAKNLSPHPWVYQATRVALNINRALPDLVIALMFVAAVGLGPFPGVLAIAIGSIGFMAKMYAEAFEQINPRQVEAVRATGANGVQVAAYAVAPQAAPLVISYSLYLWEVNVRSATILGLVGAGGIGLSLQTSMRLFQYQEVSVIVLSLVVMVTVIDRISAYLRHKLT
jgi:phosphonate transport system permease protein